MAEAKTEKPGKAAKAPKAEGKAAAQKPAEGQKQAKGKPAAAEKAAAEGKVAAPPKDYVARLKKIYRDEIVPKLVKEFGYKNALEVPRLDKIVLNMGVGEGVNDRKKVENAAADLSIFAGNRLMASDGDPLIHRRGRVYQIQSAAPLVAQADQPETGAADRYVP